MSKPNLLTIIRDRGTKMRDERKSPTPHQELADYIGGLSDEDFNKVMTFAFYLENVDMLKALIRVEQMLEAGGVDLSALPTSGRVQ